MSTEVLPPGKIESVELSAKREPVAIGPQGIRFENYDDLVRFSVTVSKSGLAPKGLQSPEAVFVAAQMGLEIGLTAMAALQNIAVINGRPCLWGDAQLAVVRGTGQLEEFEEWFEQKGERLPRNPTNYTDDTIAVCRVKRRGYPCTEVAFGVSDAKTAGLWGKEGPWRQYPFRMLKSRARSFALRDNFGDALKGILSAEESQDHPAAIDVQRTTWVADHSKQLISPVASAQGAESPVQTSADDSSFSTDRQKQATAMQLAVTVAQAGFDFDTLVRWALGSGHLPPGDYVQWEDIPEAVAKRLQRAHVGLIKGLTQYREEFKAAEAEAEKAKAETLAPA